MTTRQPDLMTTRQPDRATTRQPSPARPGLRHGPGLVADSPLRTTRPQRDTGRGTAQVY
ncbi:hypothetical protein [Nocardia aurea]|uniref:hypothetical protein n=1 Tax=Nocardia aurea TaxID=2144174 RepID=UPI0013003EBB|nr:hypothetical protein [Nocardia aurea]